jgi:hypothetical protein
MVGADVGVLANAFSILSPKNINLLFLESCVAGVFQTPLTSLSSSKCGYSRISVSGRERIARKAPNYMIIPPKVAHPACQTRQNAQKTTRYRLSSA